MAMRLVRPIVLGIMIALVAPRAAAPAAAQPGPAAAPSAPRDDGTEEFQRLVNEMRQAAAEGQTAQAIAACHKLLTLQKQRDPEAVELRARLLVFLADLLRMQDDLAAEKPARQEILAIYEKRHGKQDWRVHDARLALYDLTLLQKLSKAQRRQLLAAQQSAELASARVGEGKIDEAARLLEQVVATRKALLGEQHRSTVDSRGYLAVVYQKAGDTSRAEPLLRKVVEAYQKILGEAHPEYARAVKNLGLLLAARGSYEDGAELVGKALAIQLKALGARAPEYLNGVAELATLQENNGDFAKAAATYAIAVDLLREIQGSESLEYAALVNRQAMAHHRAGQFDKALAHFGTALEVYRKSADKDPTGLFETLDLITFHFEDQGNWAEAIRTCEKALELRKQALGEQDTGFVPQLMRLGSLYQKQRDFDKAEQILRQALERTGKVHGQEHHDFAFVLHRLAQLQAAAAKPAAAKALFQQAAEILQNAQGDGDPEYATVLGSWAAFCRQQRQYEEAASLARRALAAWQKGQHEQHPGYVDALYELAQTYQATGDYAQAEPLFRTAADVRRKTRGEKSEAHVQALYTLAGYYAQLGDYLRASQVLEQAGTLVEQMFGADSLARAASLKQLADMYYERRMLAKCEPMYRRIVAIRRARLGENAPLYLDALADLAKMLADQGQAAEAEPMTEQYLARQRDVLGEKSPEFARALEDAAAIYRALNNEAKADELERQSIAVHHDSPGEKSAGYLESLEYWSAEHMSRGEFDRALALFQTAVDRVQREHGEQSREHARWRYSLGVLLRRAGDYAAAEVALGQALELSKQVDGPVSPTGEASLTELALLYYLSGQESRADALAEQSRDMARQIAGEDRTRWASLCGGWSTFYAERGDYVRALSLRRQSIDVLRQSVGEEHPLYAKAIEKLAELYALLDDARQALPLMLQAAEVLQRAQGEVHPDTIAAWRSVAWLYLRTGDLTRGADVLQKTQRLRRELLGENHLGLAESQLESGLLLAAIKAHDLAETQYREAIAILEKHAAGPRDVLLASALESYGELCLDRGDFDQAEALLKRSLEIRKHLGTDRNASSKASLADLYLARSRPDEAAPLALEVLRGRRRQAHLTAAVQSERQQLNSARLLGLSLNKYLSAALASGAPAEQVYQEVLASKGFVFSQQRSQRLRDESRVGPAADILKKLEQRSSELAGLMRLTPEGDGEEQHRRRLEEVSVEIERLQGELATQAHSGAAPVPGTVAELRKLLPQGVLLVDCLQYDRYSPPAAGEKQPRSEASFVAFLLRAGRPLKIVELGPARDTEAKIEAWRVAVRDGAKETHSIGDELRKRLWQPLAEYAQDCTTVLVSPDGALARLAWAALPGNKPHSYLIEDFAMATIPVAQSLVEILGPPPAAVSGDASMLIVGDVDFGASPGQAAANASGHSRSTPRGLRGTASSWPELPGTTKEAAQVRSVFEKSFSNGKVTALTRDQATEQQVRGAAPRSRYLHLATHGYFSPAPTQHPLASLFGSLVELTMVSDAVAFDGDDAGGGLDRQNTSRTFRPDRGVSEVHPGLLSGIVLAGANAEVRPDHDDGVLTALEVGQLNLSKLDLVTLSACETGLGEAAGGEGLLGLQRAFQVAGARSVMASLWQVPDDATRVLMSEFFGNLWVKKLSKIEALRQAQLSVLRRYDPRSGELRGLTVAAATPPGQSTAGLAPLYWAAFVLSGDWR